MSQNVIIALKIMGQGMAGIFVSILLIMLVISLIQKFSKTEKESYPKKGRLISQASFAFCMFLFHFPWK